MPVLVRAGFSRVLAGLIGLGAPEDVASASRFAHREAGSGATLLLLSAASWSRLGSPICQGSGVFVGYAGCSETRALVSFRLHCLVTHVFGVQEGVGLLKVLKVPAPRRKGERYQACACGAPFRPLTPPQGGRRAGRMQRLTNFPGVSLQKAPCISPLLPRRRCVIRPHKKGGTRHRVDAERGGGGINKQRMNLSVGL